MRALFVSGSAPVVSTPVTGPNIFNVSMLEAASAIDIIGGVATFGAALTEAGAALDTSSYGGVTTAVSIAETGAAVDATTVLALFSVVLAMMSRR